MSEQGRFATTRWTVVLQAAREDPGGQRPALAELYQQYQQPLYVVARVRGLAHEDTVDALHDFFCELLDGNMLAAADQQRGRFRAFLLTVWRRFLTDVYRRGAALKRGGEHQLLSIHVVADASFDQRLAAIGDSVADQDACFDLEWAESVLRRTRQLLLAGYQERGRAALAEALLPLLTVPLDGVRCAELAAQLELSTTAIKVALHRLRSRFGQLLRQVVAETVDHPDEIDDELDALLRIVAEAQPVS